MNRISGIALAVVAVGADLVGCRQGTPRTDAREETPVRTLRLSDATLTVETVYEEGFDAGLGDWVTEGPARVEARGGRMVVNARDGRATVATVWCRRPFEGDAVIEYTIRVEEGPGNTNLNLFLYGTGAKGESVLETSGERTGAYEEYHRLPNYILTYLNSDDEDRQDVNSRDPSRLRTRVRFRRDPGFRLLRETWRQAPIVKGRDYAFALVLQGARTRLYVDGELVLDHAEEETPLRRGHHAFRTWATCLSVGLFRVSRLAAP